MSKELEFTQEEAKELWCAVQIAAGESYMDGSMLAVALKLKKLYNLDEDGQLEKNLKSRLWTPRM